MDLRASAPGLAPTIQIELSRSTALERRAMAEDVKSLLEKQPRAAIAASVASATQSAGARSFFEEPPLSLIAQSPNRRATTRVAAILPVELELTPQDQGVLAARTVDIGMGGICVRTACPIDRNSVRVIRFTLGRDHLEFSVTPRWSSEMMSEEGPLTGFSFDSVDVRSEGALWNFVQERARDLSMFFRSCEGLDQLDFQDSLELALTTRLREVERAQPVYSRTRSDSIFLLFRGSVALERVSDRGCQEFARVQPGEIFGGLPTIAGCTPFERAVATENSTVLEFLGYNVEYLFGAKPLLGVSLLRAASFHWLRRFSRTLDRFSDQLADP